HRPAGAMAVAAAQVERPQPGEHLEGGAEAAAAAEERCLQAEQTRLEPLFARAARLLRERRGDGLLGKARLLADAVGVGELPPGPGREVRHLRRVVAILAEGGGKSGREARQ